MITRNEFERLTEQKAQKIALKKIEYKDYNAYISKCFNGTFEELNTITFYNGLIIKYITYPDYVVNKKTFDDYVAYVEKMLKEKCFDLDELNTINNYNDYTNKFDFINNRLYQTLEGVTIFNEKFNKKDYPYRGGIIQFFKTEKAALDYKEYYSKLKKAFNEKMQDESFFASAIEYEMYNHESAISWEGYTPALESLGLDYKKLDTKFQNIIDTVYKKVCNSVEW